MARLIDPLIADLQHEHAKAARSGWHWRSRAIRIAGWMSFFKVLAICAWYGELVTHRWTSDDRRALIRATAWSVVLIVLITALFEISPLAWMTRDSKAGTARLLLYLIPQALPIAITFGATLGILFGIGGRVFSRRVAEGVVALALIASALSFLNLGWITPAANQAFRVAASGRTDLPKGPPELTLGEISRAIHAGRRQPPAPPAWYFGEPPRYLKDLALNYHERRALSFSPLAFALFALSIAAGGSLKRWLLGIAASGAFIGYYVLLFGVRWLVINGTMPAPVAMWFPNAMFAALAGFLMIRKSRQSTWFYAAPW
jgi:lipopolysaccharide export LptBFGC system permease protein LptF